MGPGYARPPGHLQGDTGNVGRREEWDSNPRMSCPINGFQDRRLRPLGHPPGRSVVARHRPGGLPCRDECRGYRGACGRFGDLRRPLPADGRDGARRHVRVAVRPCRPALPLRQPAERSRARADARRDDGRRRRADPADPSRRSWPHRAERRRGNGAVGRGVPAAPPGRVDALGARPDPSGPGERRPAGHVVRRHHPAGQARARRRLARRRRGSIPGVGRAAPRGRLHRHVRGDARHALRQPADREGHGLPTRSVDRRPGSRGSR